MAVAWTANGPKSRSYEAGRIPDRPRSYQSRAGESIAGIAAFAGMSRSHLSQLCRPYVLKAVDIELANPRRDLECNDGDLPCASDDSEPSGDAGHAVGAPAAAGELARSRRNSRRAVHGEVR